MQIRVEWDHDSGWTECRREPDKRLLKKFPDHYGTIKVSWLAWALHKLAARLDAWAYRRLPWPKVPY